MSPVSSRGPRPSPWPRIGATLAATALMTACAGVGAGNDRGALSTTSRDAAGASTTTIAVPAEPTSTSGSTSTAPAAPPVTTTTAPTSIPATTARPAPATAAAPPTTTTTADLLTGWPAPIPVRLDRRVTDPATDGFETVVRATLTDPRGWQQAGFEFVFTDDAPFVIVLAEGDDVDALCHPYETGGRYSCQNGPVVALNADRWRHATPQWTADLGRYRQMLVNHEVGHLLGQHHPEERCRPGEPAPVMLQQSTGLRDCLANPWPLPWEIDCAARRLEPVAPGYEADPTPLCGPAA